jgi:acylphosphatase
VTAADRTVHTLITGRVQGVGYRAWAAGQARKLGLKGWVRNRRDGSVEAVFSGPAEAIERMLAVCRDGPPSALVSNVAVSDTAEPVGPEFRVLPTA